MSSSEETLKAGHPPAVKVGGMRITQHKPDKSKEEKEIRPVEEDTEGQEAGPNVPVESPPKNQNIVISGAVARGDADFPPEAIKAFHEKPVPAHDYRPAPPKNHIIQQPRK